MDIQNASDEPAPGRQAVETWIRAALEQAVRDRDGRALSGDGVEISLRLVDEAEMAALNRQYRGRSGATNVLSFPAGLPAELALALLGDIVVCAPVVYREAREQGKSPEAHWAHMLVHGTLHLLGYDHEEEEQALVMEAMETAILASLDYPCPYAFEEQAPS